LGTKMVSAMLPVSKRLVEFIWLNRPLVEHAMVFPSTRGHFVSVW
jgi:hypothetical protein